jgi:hypothetical protein
MLKFGEDELKMDPDAALRQLLEALEAEDRDSVSELCDALRG